MSVRETEDLLDALDDEYKAIATYQQVLADFVQFRPFSNIVEAEQRHVDALVVLFERYGIDIPANPWMGRTPRYSSIEEACQGGVDAEIDHAVLYDRLLSGTERDDLRWTYRNLQRASQENHLPAFERHTGRGGARRGRGSGGGPAEGPAVRRGAMWQPNDEVGLVETTASLSAGVAISSPPPGSAELRNTSSLVVGAAASGTPFGPVCPSVMVIVFRPTGTSDRAGSSNEG